MAATVDRPMPLSQRLRVCAALDGVQINLSKADYLALAQILEFHEKENPAARMAALTHEHRRFQLYSERLMGFVSALLAAYITICILRGPVAVLTALIAELSQ